MQDFKVRVYCTLWWLFITQRINHLQGLVTFNHMTINHWHLITGWLIMWQLITEHLTPSLLACFSLNQASFHVPSELHNSFTDYARELFKPLKDLTSLRVRNEKNSFWFGFWIFCEWCHKWSTFRPFWPTSSGPGPKPLNGSISLKFLLETRLKSESFDTLDDLLEFQVQKLRPKNNKISN